MLTDLSHIQGGGYGDADSLLLQLYIHSALTTFNGVHTQRIIVGCLSVTKPRFSRHLIPGFRSTDLSPCALDIRG